MKIQLIFGISALSLLSLSGVVGQSTFQFQNLVPPSVDAPVFDAQGNRLAGATYAAELWDGATVDSLSPTVDWDTDQRLTLPFLTGAAAGYFTSYNEQTVLQAPPGGYAWVQVRAWDTTLGSSYEEVAALGIGGYGESPLLYAQGGSPFDLLGTPKPLIGLQSFSLRAVIPEPSTCVLLALGGLIFWRAVRWRHS